MKQLKNSKNLISFLKAIKNCNWHQNNLRPVLEIAKSGTIRDLFGIYENSKKSCVLQKKIRREAKTRLNFLSPPFLCFGQSDLVSLSNKIGEKQEYRIPIKPKWIFFQFTFINLNSTLEQFDFFVYKIRFHPIPSTRRVKSLEKDD